VEVDKLVNLAEIVPSGGFQWQSDASFGGQPNVEHRVAHNRGREPQRMGFGWQATMWGGLVFYKEEKGKKL